MTRRGSGRRPSSPSRIPGRASASSLFGLLALALLAGCEATDPDAEPTGSTTVPTWTLGATELTIGDSPNDTLDQLWDATAASLLPGGGLAVANGPAVRLYGPDGSHRVTLGREGEGPGEFRAVDWVGPYRGDSLGMFDARLRRLSVFDRAGTLARTVDLEGGSRTGRPGMAGVLDDGRIVLRGRVSREGPVEEGLHAQSETLTLHAPDGTVLHDFGDVPAEDIFFMPSDGGGLIFGPPPFTPQPVYRARGDRIYLARGDSMKVSVLDADEPTAPPVAVVRGPVDPPPVDETVKAAEVERRLARLEDPERRRSSEEALREMMVHDLFPVVADVRADDVGNVWIRERTPAGPSSRWHVFRPDGPPLAVVEVPADLEVLDVAAGRMVLLGEGALGEEVVTVRRFGAGEAGERPG